jgi:acyl-CoA synthetase (AMP-forming)/AMP-acid ligase II
MARYEPSLGLGADAVSLVAMPMFHVGGGAWALAGNVAGATNVILRDFDASVLRDVLASERITHAALVPAMVQAILAFESVGERDYAALRMVSYGAAPMPAPLLDRALRTFGCGFSQGYGLTETTSTVVQLEPSDHLAAVAAGAGDVARGRLRSVGRPVVGASLRIVDPESLADVPDGGVGEIWIQGPTVMKGYWRLPDATREALVDGWLRTGDAGYLDADGYLFLVDRIKDMIVSGGENIYPAEIERALASHPGVLESAVVGVASERWGETPKAFVVRRPGAPVEADELIDHCRGMIARYKCPTIVEFVRELPRTASGKVLKRALRP